MEERKRKGKKHNNKNNNNMIRKNTKWGKMLLIKST